MVYGLGFAAFCLAWLLPGHYFPWTSFQQEVAAALGALLIALAAIVSTMGQPLRVPVVSVAATVLALVPLAQWSSGKVPFVSDALLPALYLVGFALTVVAARALAGVHGDRFVMALVATLLVGAFASMVIGLGQWLRLGWMSFVEQLGPHNRVYANFTQPNHLASLLGMALLGGWWLFESRRIGALGLIALGTFLGFGIVLTQSRAGWGFVAMLALWWAIGRRLAVPLRTTSVGMGAAVFAFAMAVVLWPQLSVAVDGSPAIGVVDRVQNVGGRGVHWPAIWEAAWLQPITGWGWMQVGAAQRAVALDHPASHEWITYSHSLVLDLMVWNGALPGLLVVAAGGWWIASRMRACRDVTTWALMGAGGVLLVHALVEFPYAFTYFLLPLAVMVGIVESRTEARGASVFALQRPAFAAAGLVIAGLLAWICVEYVEVEEMARRASFKEAAYIVPRNQEPHAPDVVLLDSQREFIRFRITTARPGMAAAELENMHRINQRFMPPAVMLRYALAMGLNGRPEEASRNLQLICKMWRPKNCDEGRESWRTAQSKYPQLRTIAYPAEAGSDVSR